MADRSPIPANPSKKRMTRHLSFEPKAIEYIWVKREELTKAAAVKQEKQEVCRNLVEDEATRCGRGSGTAKNAEQGATSKKKLTKSISFESQAVGYTWLTTDVKEVPTESCKHIMKMKLRREFHEKMVDASNQMKNNHN